MKAMLHKLPVRILVYVLAVISMLLTAGSFAGLIVNNQVDEEQLRADLYWRAGNTYSRDILSHISYMNGVPSYTPMDYPFMDYTIVYSNENFSVENAADKAKVLFSTKKIKLTNLPLSSTESINGTRLAHGIIFGGDNIYHIYDLDHLNVHGYSHSRDDQFDNTVNVMIYYEIDTSIDPAGYRLLEDGYMYADVIDSLVSLSIPTFIIALVVLIMSLVALVSGTGDNLTFFAKIPFIIHLCGFGLIEVGLGALGIWILDETFSFNLLSIPSAIVLGLLIALVMITVFLWTIVNYTRRIKAHKFYQTTLLYLVVKGIKKVVRFLTNNVPVTIKAIVGVVILSLIQLVVLIALFAEPGFGLILAVIYKLAVIALVIKVLLDWKKIKDGSKRYATGDLSADINTAKMIPELRKHAEDINRIGDGIQVAVSERMKSERMKTELITNVSHDIKTPLTSIINYVDLLSKHEGESADETTKEYIDVLDRQSSRLKKLIEDLIEASKASSGNVEMKIEKVNASMVVNQAIAEFSDKLQKNNLSVITNLDEIPDALIEADGRYLWRVVDNLLNNICKYSMSGTRVYVDIAQTDETISISFKNMSATPLNISADELTERFVRGDSSRNTEGSGLGLSIARSLTELMGGNLDIAIDGDLFKAILNFPTAK